MAEFPRRPFRWAFSTRSSKPAQRMKRFVDFLIRAVPDHPQ
jgi:hypothetical protein